MEAGRGSSPRTYELRVEGGLDPRWSDWFGSLAVEFTTDRVGLPVTILRGPVPDQAALRGILAKLWDLSLTVLSVVRLDEMTTGS